MNCSGDYEEFQVCEIDSCPVAVDCQWSDWSKQGECSKSCGRGIQIWSRHKLQDERHGGLPCSGGTIGKTDCSEIPCPRPLDCQWSEWSKEGGCSKICGNGSQKWSRHKLQEERHGGKPCSGDMKRQTYCNIESCPVDCQFSEWSKDGGCSKTCGNGTQKWSRYKIQEERYGGKPCDGSLNGVTHCNTQSCPG